MSSQEQRMLSTFKEKKEFWYTKSCSITKFYCWCQLQINFNSFFFHSMLVILTRQHTTLTKKAHFIFISWQILLAVNVIISQKKRSCKNVFFETNQLFMWRDDIKIVRCIFQIRPRAIWGKEAFTTTPSNGHEKWSFAI